MIKGHGGNIQEVARTIGCDVKDIVDMSSNVNPLGPPGTLMEHLAANLGHITYLPEPDARSMTLAFSRHYDLDPNRVLAANGTTHFIYTLPLALNTKTALIVAPTYADYADACMMHNVPVQFYITSEKNNFTPDLNTLCQNFRFADTVFICNPNNPTGVLIPRNDLAAICRQFNSKRFIIDESYLPFTASGEQNSMAPLALDNVIVLNSMSKMFKIPGLRIGFSISSPQLRNQLNAFSQPWNVGSLAQCAAHFLFENDQGTRDFMNATRSFLKEEKEHLSALFNSIPEISLFPSETSFILGRINIKTNAHYLYDKLCGHRFLIRNCSNFDGLSNQFIRFSVQSRSHNITFANAIRQIFNDYNTPLPH